MGDDDPSLPSSPLEDQSIRRSAETKFLYCDQPDLWGYPREASNDAGVEVLVG